jgi:ubiquinone/menaquinone biosynthesis C-methylase UbiE
MKKYKRTWDSFADYYDWEFNIFCTEQQKDVEFWLDLAKEIGDPILELACGSGRITIPLAQAGYRITGLDYSPEMLKMLSNKSAHLKNLTILNSDMVNFQLEDQFKLIFISYSSFQQLLKEKDQIACLKNIHRHLRKDGILAMDIGRKICEGEDITQFKHLYTAFYPEDDSTVSMFTSYKTDRKRMIRYWTDKYFKYNKNGQKETYINQIALRECDGNCMQALFRLTGFKIIEVYGSFQKDPLKEESNNAIYVAKKI